MRHGEGTRGARALAAPRSLHASHARGGAAQAAVPRPSSLLPRPHSAPRGLRTARAMGTFGAYPSVAHVSGGRGARAAKRSPPPAPTSSRVRASGNAARRSPPSPNASDPRRACGRAKRSPIHGTLLPPRPAPVYRTHLHCSRDAPSAGRAARWWAERSLLRWLNPQLR